MGESSGRVVPPGVGAAAQSQERMDLHNVSIDDEVAVKLHCCGQIHLPTGRVCTREERHAGSCWFRSHDEVAVLMSSSPTSEET